MDYQSSCWANNHILPDSGTVVCGLSATMFEARKLRRNRRKQKLSRTGAAGILGFLQLLFPALVACHCFGQRFFARLAFQDAAQTAGLSTKALAAVERGTLTSRHFHGWNIAKWINPVENGMAAKNRKRRKTGNLGHRLTQINTDFGLSTRLSVSSVKSGLSAILSTKAPSDGATAEALWLRRMVKNACRPVRFNFSKGISFS